MDRRRQWARHGGKGTSARRSRLHAKGKTNYGAIAHGKPGRPLPENETHVNLTPKSEDLLLDSSDRRDISVASVRWTIDEVGLGLDVACDHDELGGGRDIVHARTEVERQRLGILCCDQRLVASIREGAAEQSASDTARLRLRVNEEVGKLEMALARHAQCPADYMAIGIDSDPVFRGAIPEVLNPSQLPLPILLN